MHFATKGALTLGLIAAAAMSQALSYTNVVATVTFDGTTTVNMNTLVDGNSITFTSLPPMIVSTIGPHTSAVVNISYDVHSNSGINGLDLIFTGATLGDGNVGYDEKVFDSGSNEVASISGNKSGTWSEEDLLSFSGGALNDYSVTKEFTLDLTQQNAQFKTLGLQQGTLSMASIGLIEQNAVPEPATLGAVGVGLFGLMTRKRRK